MAGGSSNKISQRTQMPVSVTFEKIKIQQYKCFVCCIVKASVWKLYYYKGAPENIRSGCHYPIVITIKRYSLTS